jgi:hypothetical protein
VGARTGEAGTSQSSTLLGSGVTHRAKGEADFLIYSVRFIGNC